MITEPVRRPALPDDARLEDHRHLALALGGDATSFTGDLLRLIAKADPGNRARLTLAYPRTVRAWEWWYPQAPHLTTRELLDHLEAEGQEWTVEAALARLHDLEAGAAPAP